MRILFATLALDGHFNPLTGIAVHLREVGHDVRWYTGPGYAQRLERLGIPHLLFKRAREIGTVAELLPDKRARLKALAQLRFAFAYLFFGNVEAYFEDVREINDEFDFDVLFCDTSFMAARLVRQVLGKHVCGVGIATVVERSKDAPPNLGGLKPARTPAGRLIHQLLAATIDRVLLSQGRDMYNRILAAHGLPAVHGSIFDEFDGSQDVVFQSGVPGFEYKRREVNPRRVFVGPLLPHRTREATGFAYGDRLAEGQRVILISQGTVDNRDPQKLIVPALDALVDTGALLVVGTGHQNTEELRRNYPQTNVVIEDYVDFEAVLERADVFVCNGGFGSVMLGLSKGVPIVASGIREGKGEVNARVEYFGVGINLRSEKPTSDHIRRAADRVLSEPRWKERAMALRDEMSWYRPHQLIDQYLESSGVGSG
jgi:MGT family glycosyltransferase